MSSTLLADALRELALQPGESRWFTVDAYEVEVRRLAIEEALPMADIYLNVPPSPKAATFVAEKKRTAILPRPIVITEDDLTPGDLGSEDGWFTS